MVEAESNRPNSPNLLHRIDNFFTRMMGVVFKITQNSTKREREEMPERAFSLSTKETLTTVDEDGNLVDNRTKIEFPLEEEKDVFSSHADVVQLVARSPNGEQLGGSGLVIPYRDAKFVVTSAANVVVTSMRNGDIKPRENQTGFKKRNGVDGGYNQLLEFEDVAIHPFYDGNSTCGFDISVMKVDQETRGTLANHGRPVHDYSLGPAEVGQVAEGRQIRLHGYPQEK